MGGALRKHDNAVKCLLAFTCLGGTVGAAPMAAQAPFDFELRQVRWAPLDDEAEIRGVVIDSETGEPLASATVIVLGSVVGTISDEDGWFRLVDPPSAWDALEVTKAGFERKTIERPGPGSWSVRVLLSPHRMDLCGLEVSGPLSLPIGHLQIRARSVTTGNEIPVGSVRATLHNLRDGAGSESVLQEERVLEDGRILDARVLVRIRGVGAHVLRVEADGFEPWWTAPISFTSTNCGTPRGRAFDAWLVPTAGSGEEPG